MAAGHTVTVPNVPLMHVVKILYITTFHWGLKIATYCCIVVSLCFFQARCTCCHVIPVPMHSVKFLYTGHFHFGL